MAQAEEYRAKMLDQAATYDDDLLMKVLEGEEISEEEIKAAIRKGTLAVELFPVLCGSAYKDKGVQPMLDAVIDFYLHQLTFLQSKVLMKMVMK